MPPGQGGDPEPPTAQTAKIEDQYFPSPVRIAPGEQFDESGLLLYTLGGEGSYIPRPSDIALGRLRQGERLLSIREDLTADELEQFSLH